MILWHNCCYATVRTPVNFVTIPNIVKFVEVPCLDLDTKDGNGRTTFGGGQRSWLSNHREALEREVWKVAIVTIVTIKRILDIAITVTIIKVTKEFCNQTMKEILMEKCGN